MFPISDDNPRRRLGIPYVAWSLIAANVAVFFWQASLGPQAGQEVIFSLGMIPARLFTPAELPPEMVVVPAWATIFTSMFMHGGWLHLGGNMLFLWIFGDNVEDSMGHGRFLAFYVLCGVAAALGQGLLDPASTVPMVGASGAISGVLGAYLLLHPRATVRVLIFFGFIFIAHVPAMFVLGIWFLGQLMNALATPPGQPGIAFAAHIGGFVAGLVLVPFFKRPDVGLFQPPHHRAWERERRRGPWG
jgi:membrane associated rhomboid family serine protease